MINKTGEARYTLSSLLNYEVSIRLWVLLIGIICIVAILLLIKYLKKKEEIEKTKPIKVKKLSDILKEKNKHIKKKINEVKEPEKIKVIESKNNTFYDIVDKLRNRKKIKELKEKIKELEEEIEGLGGKF